MIATHFSMKVPKILIIVKNYFQSNPGLIFSNRDLKVLLEFARKNAQDQDIVPHLQKDLQKLKIDKQNFLMEFAKYAME